MLGKNKNQFLFVVVMALMVVGSQKVAALKADTNVFTQSQKTQKKIAQNENKEFWCATSDMGGKVDAEIELLLEPQKSDVVLGQPVRKVYPGYPLKARVAKVEGVVIIEALVSKTGEVVSIKSVLGNPVLIQASRDSAKKWRFTPTIVKGQPIEVLARITFKYDLEIEEKQPKGKTRNKIMQR